MVYDFTNPIYILLMILLFGVPIVTPVIYGQYRSTTTGFDLGRSADARPALHPFPGCLRYDSAAGYFPHCYGAGAGAGAPGEYSGRHSLILFALLAHG